MSLKNLKTKKEQANKFAPDKIEPKKILKPKEEQANKSVLEKYFLIVYKHTVKCMITLCILKLL